MKRLDETPRRIALKMPDKQSLHLIGLVGARRMLNGTTNEGIPVPVREEIMRAHLRALAAAALIAGGVLSGPAIADEASDKAAIEDIWTTYSAAVVEGDADTWLSLWDEGGVQMPPGVPARGIDALKQSAPQSFASSEVDSMNIYPEEISVADGWAYSRGTYEIDEVIDGEDTHFEGKFMTILRRQNDGSWKIYRDIFNASTP